jgi:hypothetical protein
MDTTHDTGKDPKRGPITVDLCVEGEEHQRFSSFHFTLLLFYLLRLWNFVPLKFLGPTWVTDTWPPVSVSPSLTVSSLVLQEACLRVSEDLAREKPANRAIYEVEDGMEKMCMITDASGSPKGRFY